MRRVTIKAGNHYSHWLPRFWVGESYWQANFVFTESCKYALPDQDQDDWNKLFGVAFGLNPHRNSARWAWRYSYALKVVELTPYVYRDGTRIISESTPLRQPIGVSIRLEILVEHGAAYFGKHRTGRYTDIIPVYGSFAGAKLQPYFGGNQPAPHDTIILTDW